jgi:hypothetical protein
MVQNWNRMVNELASADIMFASHAAFSGEPKIISSRASNMNNGAPGG